MNVYRCSLAVSTEKGCGQQHSRSKELTQHPGFSFQPHVPHKGTRAPWKNSWFQDWQGKYKKSLEPCCTRKEGRSQRMVVTCEKDPGANLKGLPLAKYGTI